MIIINKTFSTKKDKHCWVLYEIQQKNSEKKGDYETVKETYHANITQVCEAVLNRTAGKCGSVEEIKNLFENAVEKVVSVVKPEKRKRVRRTRN